MQPAVQRSLLVGHVSCTNNLVTWQKTSTLSINCDAQVTRNRLIHPWSRSWLWHRLCACAQLRALSKPLSCDWLCTNAHIHAFMGDGWTLSSMLSSTAQCHAPTTDMTKFLYEVSPTTSIDYENPHSIKCHEVSWNFMIPSARILHTVTGKVRNFILNFSHISACIMNQFSLSSSDFWLSTNAGANMGFRVVVRFPNGRSELVRFAGNMTLGQLVQRYGCFEFFVNGERVEGCNDQSKLSDVANDGEEIEIILRRSRSPSPSYSPTYSPTYSDWSILESA